MIIQNVDLRGSLAVKRCVYSLPEFETTELSQRLPLCPVVACVCLLLINTPYVWCPGSVHVTSSQSLFCTDAKYVVSNMGVTRFYGDCTAAYFAPRVHVFCFKRALRGTQQTSKYSFHNLNLPQFQTTFNPQTQTVPK